MKNETVPEKKDTTRQANEFGAAVLKQLPHMTPQQMQFWIRNQGMLSKELKKALNIPDPRKEWEKFYLEVFDIKVNFSKLNLPPQEQGFNWLIVVRKGLTELGLIEKAKSLFPVEVFVRVKYLDPKSLSSARETSKNYCLWIRDRIEADHENENKQPTGVTTHSITFTERMLLELFYFWKTGNHLDVENRTVCGGSHASGLFFTIQWRKDKHALVIGDYDFINRQGSRDRNVRI